MNSDGRRTRKGLIVAFLAGVAIMALVFIPIQECPSCRGTGAWNADPMFGGQCGGGCGGSGRRSLWKLVFPPTTGRAAAVPPSPESHRDPYVPRPLLPLRPSGELKATLMVPTLGAPLSKGKSVLWCGAFQLAWNQMKTDVIHEPIRIQGAEALCTALNTSPFSEADLATGSFYAAAGRAEEGIESRIRKEMADRFPGVQPNLPPVPQLSAIAYAYLASSLRFKHAYRAQQEGVPFREGSGRLLTVRGFGVRPADYEYRDALHQPRVLYRGIANPADECIVDLDPDSSPNQILVAMQKTPGSLAEALSWVERKMAMGESTPLETGDTLLVPEVAVGVFHHFSELEGTDKVVLNKDLHGDFVAAALQTIQFRLDRGGVELRSEAVVATAKAAAPREPVKILFNRPFLLLMKTRGASHPYLVVWVDNVELLEEMH